MNFYLPSNLIQSQAIKMRLIRMLLSVFKTFFDNFNKNSKLPGFKFIGKLKSKKKTFIWYLLSLVSLSFCFYLIYLQYIRFRYNVTHLKVLTNGYPVWKRPFPAVTICNVNVVHKAQSLKFRDML